MVPWVYFGRVVRKTASSTRTKSNLSVKIDYPIIGTPTRRSKLMIGVLCCNCIGFGWNSKTVGKRRSRTYGFWSSPRKKIASMNGLMIILSHC